MKPLFESNAELSSDLQWLLQNGEASHEPLANLLARDYYSSALCLSWAVLGDLDQAREAVMRAFTTVLVNQYRYSSGENVQIWLFKIILQAAKRALRSQRKFRAAQVSSVEAPESKLDAFLQPLDEADRWALYVTVLLGWQPADASKLVNIELKRVEHLVNAFHQEFLVPLPSSQSIQASKTLAQALIERFPRQKSTEGEQEEIVARLLHAAQRDSKKNQKLVRLWETLLMAIGISLVTGLIWWLNQSLPEGASQITRATATVKIIRATRVVLVPVTATPESPDRFLSDYTVRPGDTLDSIAQVFGMAVSDLMRLNRLSGDARLNVGQRLKVLSSVRRRLPAGSSAARSGDLPPPLNGNSTPRQIVQRLASSQSLWSTIQVDARLVLNGPPGYIGPPDVTYEQVWIDNLDKRSIELSGKSSTQPDWVYAASGHRSSQIDRVTSRRQDFPGNQMVKNDTLRAMLFPLNSDWLSSTGSLTIGPVTPYIGRETLQVGVKDASNFLQAQLWIDVETGIILRELRYSGDRLQTQTADYTISRINYNDYFPDGLFNPQKRLAAGFSQYTSGFASKLENRATPTVNSQAHQSFFAGLPPPGFNLSQAQLYFRFPKTFNTEASSAMVRILAGGYSLGETQFGNPWTTLCARSPDGYKIAYVSQPFDAGPGGAALHWFDLRNVNHNQTVSEDLAVNNFAFSEDSQRLAFFGRQAGQARGAVYIYDLLSGALQRLLDRNSANSLVWSPDGNYLAMISDPSQLGNQDAWVVDVRDGRAVAHDRYNWRGEFSLDPLMPDWPTFKWRHPDGSHVQFPVAMGGLQSCVLANMQAPE